MSVSCTILPTARHYNAGISGPSIVVNFGGGPRPFAPRGQAERKSALPRAIAVRPCATLLSSGWCEPAVERWSGCSLRLWLCSAQMMLGPLPATTCRLTSNTRQRIGTKRQRRGITSAPRSARRGSHGCAMVSGTTQRARPCQESPGRLNECSVPYHPISPR